MQDFVEVPLTRGKVALVDVSDLLVVGHMSWRAMPTHGRWYAQWSYRDGSKNRTEFMHRRIMEPPPGFVVDHINGDGLDNRRANLRVCSVSQNTANRQAAKKQGMSQFFGVRAESGGRKWAAVTKKDGQTIRIGLCSTPEEAARAYDVAVTLIHGDFARTNFPVTADDIARLSWVADKVRSALPVQVVGVAR